jgi:glucose/arabinose dehydrogenase
MKTIQRLAVVGLIALALLALSSQLSPGPSTVHAQSPSLTVDRIIASGFTNPVQVTHAGDGSNRLFVVEQPGTIRIIQEGTVLPIPFLDLTALTVDVGERGLLGLVFHPDYATNGFLYVNYTQASGGDTVVARYTVSSSDPNSADPGSALTVLTVEQPFANHNGGQLAFGPDGYLYIGMGDGGSGGDPQGHGQDPTTLLGALLRIDVDGDESYTIPPDNPYVDAPGRDEIWAIGLRNPWRFSFDRSTGDLYIGDVGQNAWEEISFQAAGTPGGLNFGWNCLEGTHPYAWEPACETVTLTGPIAEYDHSQGRSVTGGFVYRGTDYPALIGRYVYGDFVSGRIWSLDTGDLTSVTPVLELDTSLNISSFGEDERGELYVVDRSGGTIHLLAGSGEPFVPSHLIYLPIILRVW